jgi:hypothetical protein
MATNAPFSIPWIPGVSAFGGETPEDPSYIRQLQALAGASRLGAIGGAAAGMSPEEILAAQQQLQMEIAGREAAFQKQPFQRTLRTLTRGVQGTVTPKAAEAPYVPTPSVTPPSPKVEPASKPDQTVAPKTKTVLRLVTDPASGQQTWTTANVTTENDEAGYQNALGQSAAARMRDNAAYAQAGQDMSTSSQRTGERSPQGFASRMNTEGAFSGSWNPDAAALAGSAKDYNAYYQGLSPLQRDVADEARQHGLGIQAQELQMREATAQAGLRDQALKEAEDPLGFRRAQAAQLRGQAEQEFADPRSPLSIRFRVALNEYIAKYPNSTKEQRDDYAAIIQDQLLSQASMKLAEELRLPGYGMQQGRPTDPQFSQSFGFGAPQ